MADLADDNIPRDKGRGPSNLTCVFLWVKSEHHMLVELHADRPPDSLLITPNFMSREKR